MAWRRWLESSCEQREQISGGLGEVRDEEVRDGEVRNGDVRDGDVRDRDVRDGRRKLPETPDEWREKVSPVITFPRLIAKSWSAFSKSRVIFKKPTAGFLAPKIAK